MLFRSVAFQNGSWEREEEVRGVTSSMLRILEDDTELVANATRATSQQLYFAREALGYIRDDWCGEAVAEGLVPKLDELHDLISKKV